MMVYPFDAFDGFFVLLSENGVFTRSYWGKVMKKNLKKSKEFT
jgi:hypothetical protein